MNLVDQTIELIGASTWVRKVLNEIDQFWLASFFTILQKLNIIHVTYHLKKRREWEMIHMNTFIKILQKSQYVQETVQGAL